ncbi:DUF1294 domain-containing protein [Undibacterium sp. MH2W]|uniref:DUF1294 domain-containing protein n=1 Tax=Undibacterium sp. MH2W TaxID=3413044 RepID=UPI003BF08738
MPTSFFVLCCVSGFYLLISTVTFIYYWIDKRAAKAQRQRVPERRLLSLCLAGGWPGAILAHRLLRHKSVKRSYQRWFRLMIFLHIVGLGQLVTCIYQAMQT